jgi:hypothetical protein
MYSVQVLIQTLNLYAIVPVLPLMRCLLSYCLLTVDIKHSYINQSIKGQRK